MKVDVKYLAIPIAVALAQADAPDGRRGPAGPVYFS
jgi:hypothetical protein